MSFLFGVEGPLFFVFIGEVDYTDFVPPLVVFVPPEVQLRLGKFGPDSKIPSTTSRFGVLRPILVQLGLASDDCGGGVSVAAQPTSISA